MSIHRITLQRDINRKRAFEIAILATIIIAIFLGFNGYRTLELDRDTALANDAVNTWLEGTSFTVTRLSLNYPPGDILVSGPAHATINIAGTGEIGSIDQLARMNSAIARECERRDTKGQVPRKMDTNVYTFGQ